MKKFITMVTALTLAASLLAGCGKEADADTAESQSSEAAAETESTEETAAEEAAAIKEYGEDAYVDGIDLADYVTLGEYMGIEVSVDAPAVTDEYVQSYIEYVLQSNLISTEVTDRPVETGDIVNIDYEGKIDGVAFEGGTDQGHDLEIGSGSFIDGFEDGLIGAKIGETLDVKVTFPEDYRNAEVAGKDAVFTVTVNSIHTESLPVLTDEFVQGLEVECDTVEEFEQYVYDLLMEDEQATHDANAQLLILDAVKANCEFKELPEAIVTRYYDRIRENMNYYASMYGYDLETFLAANGSSEDEIKQNAEEAAKEILVMKAIAEAEGLEVTEDEMEAELAETAELYGYELEDYKASIDVKAYKEYMMTNKVLDFLLENAVVTDVEAEAETETADETETTEETAGTEETESTEASEE